MAFTASEEALVRQLLDQQAAILSLAGNEATITSKLGATKVTLADLVAASSLADADLLLTRQGTTDKSVRADILATYMGAELGALFAPIANPTFTGDPKAPTPAQFDNDTSLATTEFVQRALGNRRMSRQIGVNTTLGLGDIGTNIQITAACTITLPLANGVPLGAMITFLNNTPQAATIQRQGTEGLSIGSSGFLTSVALTPGEALQLINVDGGGWFSVGGSLHNQFAGSFSRSIASSGWQRLPSGLIIQWGVTGATTTTTTPANLSATMPIAFPNNIFSAVATRVTDVSASAAPFTADCVSFISLTQLTIAHARSAGSVENNWRWIAVGN